MVKFSNRRIKGEHLSSDKIGKALSEQAQINLSGRTKPQFFIQQNFLRTGTGN